ncbi:AMP-binding protein [Rhodomicrobium lacus]|uniref:AMP-binding protein n=1 Tax=Rhodomicrobium lacus TaxID=2498452 RepID=UPI000F8D5330|nr:AMP-binding protein [Rhodomicrobium lacus]
MAFEQYALTDRTVGHILADKARKNGGKTFLTFEHSRVSYEELHVRTNRLANGFADLGIRKGERVGLLLDNTPDLLLIELALGKIGAVAVPINSAARGDLLRYFVQKARCVAVVVEAELSDRLWAYEEDLTDVRLVIVRGKGAAVRSFRGVTAQGFEGVEKGSDATPDVDVRFSDPHFVLFTSGTTGPSKGVLAAQAQGWGTAEIFTRHTSLSRDDILYTCLPLFHVNAIWNTSYTAIWTDAEVALSRRFSASRFWDEIRAAGATQFAALGAMITIIWNQPERPDDADNPVRLCFTVPTPADFIQKFESRFALKNVTWFSMSENFPIVMYLPGDPLDKMASMGKPRGDAEVRIVDENDVELPAGEIGELVFRPADPWRVMLGYDQMAEATVSNNRNFWFHTGDRAWKDEDGWFWYVDRIKDSIRRRGENISTQELEALVRQHPDIDDVAAIAVPSELSEDEVMIYVKAREGAALTAEGIIRFCDGRMPYYMVPRYVDFVDEFPLTPTEKIQKYKLRERALATLSNVFDREKAGIKVSR